MEFLPLAAQMRPSSRRRWEHRGYLPPGPPDTRRFYLLYPKLVPELSPDQFPRVQRRERIRKALAMHGVLTEGQLTRYCGADSVDLNQLWGFPTYAEPVHGRGTLVEVVLRTADPRVLPASERAKLKMVALADIYLCQRPGLITSWRRGKMDDTVGNVQPSVIATTAQGRQIAVEYERGNLEIERVVAKITTLAQHFDKVWWMVPASVPLQVGGERANPRELNIERRLRSAGVSDDVLARILVSSICWWDQEREIRR